MKEFILPFYFEHGHFDYLRNIYLIRKKNDILSLYMHNFSENVSNLCRCM